MAKKKIDRNLPPQAAGPKPAYSMPEPNDDMAAFGWDLAKVRFPAPGLKRGDVWSGPPIFSVRIPIEMVKLYGPDIQFLNPRFLQILFDASPEVQAAAEKAKAARYTNASIAELQKTILDVFKNKIVPNIVSRFENISDGVAQFYAARLAWKTKFGDDVDEDVT
jgi:hypothetical protein